VRSLVRNGRFLEGADGLDGWAAWGKEKYKVTRVDSGFGKATPVCLNVEAAGNVQVGITQELPGFIAGKQYVLRGCVKAENAVHNVRYEIQTREHALVANTDSVTGTRDWTWLRIEFTAPQGTDPLVLFIVGNTSAQASPTPGSFSFAAVELYAAH
jgi:hypothetical protein